MIVVDTSALLATVDTTDAQHARAVATLEDIVASGAELVIPNYVAAETMSLVSRRLGMPLMRALHGNSISRMRTLWTTPLEHAAAVERFLESGRALSFVDCATMATMRARALTTIFTFDDDFARAGFTPVPE